MSRIRDTKGTLRDTGYTYVQGVAKRTFVDTPGLPRVSTTYDINGNIASYIDANGNLTCYSFDAARNLETKRIEGLASSGTCVSRIATNATRTIETEWHATQRLKKRIAEPLRITTNRYHGEPGVACAPAGQIRIVRKNRAGDYRYGWLTGIQCGARRTPAHLVIHIQRAGADCLYRRPAHGRGGLDHHRLLRDRSFLRDLSSRRPAIHYEREGPDEAVARRTTTGRVG